MLLTRRKLLASAAALGGAAVFARPAFADNGNSDGARRTYTLVPPLLTYHRYREINDASMTVVGPFVFDSDNKRRAFDVAPLFFHIDGKPETGGIRESHTTLFPLFHYGYKGAESLTVTPLFLSSIPRLPLVFVSFFVNTHTLSNTPSTPFGPPFL